MLPNTPVLATPSGHAQPAQTAPSGNCVIGIPATTGVIDAGRLRPVVLTLLSRHEKVMVLLASELLAYEGYPAHAGNGSSRPGGTLRERVSEDTMARWMELEELKLSLKAADHQRMHIASWAHYTDARFAELWRALLSAFARNRRFRNDMLGLTRENGANAERDDDLILADRAHALSRLECLAMRLRICEIGGYYFDYGTGDDEAVTRSLYDGTYAADGLTVEVLVGHPARRQFVAL